MKKVDLTYKALIKLYNQKNISITAEEIAHEINIQRSNASAYLNLLCKKNKAEKINTRPVVFKPIITDNPTVFDYNKKDVFTDLIGHDKSLKIPIEQAKATIMYPPNGLNTIILGPTGVGKNIYVESDVIKALLIYECKNNVGQLKNDIKIGCARSFLDYIGISANLITKLIMMK